MAPGWAPRNGVKLSRKGMMMTDQVTADIPRTIAPESFFNIGNYESELAGIPAAEFNAAFPVLLNSRMGESVFTGPGSGGVLSSGIEAGGSTFGWLLGMDPSLWESLPVRRYRPAEPTGHRRDLLTSALAHLARAHPDLFALVRSYVRMICWLSVPPPEKLQIASASAPTLPFTIFTSDLGPRDLPPGTVTESDCHRVLAENLLHETTHQRISFHLLEADVLAEDYDSATAAKVEIAWRKGKQQSEWEVDRVLHAAIVYNEVLRYRLREIQDASCDPVSLAAFREAGDAATGSVTFLADSLLGFERYFTGYGVEIVRGLRQRTAKIVSAWQECRAGQ